MHDLRLRVGAYPTKHRTAIAWAIAWSQKFIGLRTLGFVRDDLRKQCGDIHVEQVIVVVPCVQS